MSDQLPQLVLQDVSAAFRRQKDLAERAIEQLPDDAFFRAIDAESNSVAVLVKHIAGNFRSRWTNFLTSDGEKADRDRDAEFVVPPGTSRAELLDQWRDGWTALFDTLATLAPEDLQRTVHLRGEPMAALSALNRGLVHVSQHVGQIVFLAKHLRGDDWKTLSIPRGRSREYAGATATPPR